MTTENVGIPVAVATATGKRYGRNAINPDPRHRPWGNSTLRCGGCSAPVSPVRGSSRRAPGGGLVQVSPFFRLYPKRHHEPECRYDWDAQTGKLLVESRAVLSKQGEVFELRLPATEAETRAPSAPADGATRKRVAKLQVRPNTHITLPKVLATARAIAKLLRTMQDPELAERFRVRFGDAMIAWEDFYIDLTDPEDYRDRLLRLEALAGVHPVAVAGTVIAQGTTSKVGPPCLDISQRRGVRAPSRTGWLHPRITLSGIDSVTYPVGCRVLAYGHWKSFPARWDGDNHYVSLLVTTQEAITKLEQ